MIYPTSSFLAFSISTILAYIELCLLIRAIVLLSEAFYWRRFEEVTKSADTESEKTHDISSSINHALATVSIKFNAMFQALAALLSSACNIAAIFVVVLGLKSEYEMMNQTNGTAIITAPFFLGVAYFGYTAATTGSNKRLVAFLSLSVLCGLLSFVEGGGSAVALANRWDMVKGSVRICNKHPDSWYGVDCRWVSRENEDEFVSILIALNVIILVVAVMHLALSIWGIYIASVALHKDGACVRCFRNCFCCRECEGGCLAGVTTRSSAHYQPIQFVVSHQGVTTMADGQQALVVLLPLNKDVNVKTESNEAGAATVTVNGNHLGINSETNDDANLLTA